MGAAAQRWSDEQMAEAYLLAESKPLVEAGDLLNRHPEMLSSKEGQFVLASIENERMRRKREADRRRKVLTVIRLALVVAIVFGVISYWEYQNATVAALNEKKAADAANKARDQADGLINFMLFDLRDKLEPIGRLAILDDVVRKAKEYLDGLPKDLVTASRLRQQAVMLENLGNVLVAQGKLDQALEVYQQSRNILQKLSQQDPANSGWQREL
ncbi:MAG: hypothetical protein JO279_13495, partial [Verrucomicrobia bacterium]|nr:hypothetical protein [Verrucomicrobiota bacterium]